MKNIVKVTNSSQNFKPIEIIIACSYHILIGLLGFICARAIVLDKLLPFGLSFLAGCSLTYTPAAAIGVFIGYFIPVVTTNGFKYLAALFAILSIKLLLGNYKKLVSSPIFLSFISLLASFFTSVVTISGLGGNILDCITEAIFCTAGTFFFAKCFIILSRVEKLGFSAEEFSNLIICISVILIGLSSITINGISLGRIIGAAIILTAAKYGNIAYGAISGIAVAFTLAITGISGNIAVTFAFAGLLAGIFSSLGKYCEVVILIIISFVGSVTTGDTELVSRTVIETVLGSIIFLIIPRSAGIYLSKVFCASPKLAIPESFKKTLTMRLNMAAGALKDVSKTVDKVSLELSKINSPDFSAVINGIEQDACKGCKLRIHCWETKRDQTVAAILEMTKAIKQGENSPETAATDEFKMRCIRPSNVANASYRRYSDYASKIAAENRIDEVRSVVSDQFEGISSMLNDLALDFENDEQFNSIAAENTAVALKNINIFADECCGRIDKYGRMSIELKLKKTPELVINKLQVMKVASLVCERDFDIPIVSEVGGNIFIVLNEKADIAIDIGVEQISASQSSMCGDAYKYFNDGRGHFIMVLSDGMGTGGRAAVDGAMASGLMARLIKAGFGYDCSLRILNSSMLFKSTDESLATVDIASIDLYTGVTSLYKAGAAPTILRRSGKTGKAESSSLPVGILRDISFDKAFIKCKVGDIVVLMSDGVVSEGTDWIRQEIASWQEGNAQQLAEHLSLCAKRRRTDNHQDDITVMCAILKSTA